MHLCKVRIVYLTNQLVLVSFWYSWLFFNFSTFEEWFCCDILTNFNYHLTFLNCIETVQAVIPDEVRNDSKLLVLHWLPLCEAKLTANNVRISTVAAVMAAPHFFPPNFRITYLFQSKAELCEPHSIQNWT